MLAERLFKADSDALRMIQPAIANKLYIKKTYKLLRDLTKSETLSFSAPFVNEKRHFFDIVQNVIFYLGGNNNFTDPEDKLARILLQQTLATPGKGSRIYLCNTVFKELIDQELKKQFSESDLNTVIDSTCCLIECLHNLSLVVDDYIDGDQIRRGKPTIHVAGGVNAVVQISRLLTNVIYRLIDSFPVSSQTKFLLSSRLIQRSEKASIAVIKEIKWDTKKNNVPWEEITEENIQEIYLAKSTEIIKLALDFFSIILNIPKKTMAYCYNYIGELGVFLQRINDLENFSITKKNNEINYDRFSDIKRRRLTLLNFNLRILNNSKLVSLRNKAYEPSAGMHDMEKYYTGLMENGILDNEIESLRAKFNAISIWIDGFAYLSSKAKRQLVFLLKLYYKQIDEFTFS